MPTIRSDSNSEDLLINRATQGDEEAFSILYRNNVQRVYSYIYYRTGNSADAEDLTSRVFQRAMKHMARFEKKGVPFIAWLYRIAHNLVANWHRDNSRKKEVPIDDQHGLVHHGLQPEASVMYAQQHHVLIKAIQTLSSDRQNLIVLKFIEEYSNAEIAAIMGRTEGAIKSLYHRTLEELRAMLGSAIDE